MLLNCGVGEDSWESLGLQDMKPVNLKGNQSWKFIGRTDAKAEAAIFWPPHAKNWLIGKDPDFGKDWRKEEKGTTGDKMVGRHHQLSGHEFEQAPRVGDGQGTLACCIHGVAKSWLRDWTELNWVAFFPHFSFCGWFLVSCQVVALLKIKLPPFFFFWKSFHFFFYLSEIFLFFQFYWEITYVTI